MIKTEFDFNQKSLAEQSALFPHIACPVMWESKGFPIWRSGRVLGLWGVLNAERHSQEKRLEPDRPFIRIWGLKSGSGRANGISIPPDPLRNGGSVGSGRRIGIKARIGLADVTARPPFLGILI